MKKKLLMGSLKMLLIFLVFVFLLFIGEGSSFAEEVRGVTNDTIKIGVIIDQTGPIAGDIGLPITEALKIYTRHVNDSGGIFGRKVQLIVEDDRYSIPAGIAAFKKLLFKDRIFLMVGPASVGETKALFGQIDKLKVPTITGAPDEIVVNPLRKYIFMTFNVYDDQLGVIFDYIVHDLKSPKANTTFIYFDAESGKVAFTSAKKWARFFNLDLDTEIINMGALDAASQVMSIKRKNPTHIIIHHGSPGTIVLLRELRKFGLNIPVYGTMVTCTEDTVRMAGSASKNYVGAHPYSSWYDDMEGTAEMRNITLKYKPGTEKPYRSKIYTLGWGMAVVLCEGIKRTGKDLNVESFLRAMESIKNLDMRGLCGPISFSPTNHKGLYHSRLYKADPESGRLVPIGGWRETPAVK
ncbi:MAG: amino acid/amide ABC transporter substrate-binding protein HAAT family [bacterium]|nr:MAG: amino acid/amide ABC transporter substrate-binding protein HAAT family [bacterium]